MQLQQALSPADAEINHRLKKKRALLLKKVADFIWLYITAAIITSTKASHMPTLSGLCSNNLRKPGAKKKQRKPRMMTPNTAPFLFERAKNWMESSTCSLYSFLADSFPRSSTERIRSISVSLNPASDNARTFEAKDPAPSIFAFCGAMLASSLLFLLSLTACSYKGLKTHKDIHSFYHKILIPKRLWLFSLLLSASVIATSAQAFCFEEAGIHYGVSPQLLRAIADVESSLNPSAINRTNRNKSEDLGLMQINSQWLPILASYGIDRQRLLKDACLNTFIGAWILSDNFARNGFNWDSVGGYNAGFSKKRAHLRAKYSKKIQKKLASMYIAQSSGLNSGHKDGQLITRK